MKHAEKMPAPKDWHPADIKAALTKAGWSINQLGHHHGYTSKSALAAVLRHPWPKAEGLIADAIGVQPQAIWPSRYNADGTPNRVKGPKPLKPAHVSLSADYRQSITATKGGNPQKRVTKLTVAPSGRSMGTPS